MSAESLYRRDDDNDDDDDDEGETFLLRWARAVMSQAAVKSRCQMQMLRKHRHRHWLHDCEDDCDDDEDGTEEDLDSRFSAGKGDLVSLALCP